MLRGVRHPRCWTLSAVPLAACSLDGPRARPRLTAPAAWRADEANAGTVSSRAAPRHQNYAPRFTRLPRPLAGGAADTYYRGRKASERSVLPNSRWCL